MFTFILIQLSILTIDSAVDFFIVMQKKFWPYLPSLLGNSVKISFSELRVGNLGKECSKKLPKFASYIKIPFACALLFDADSVGPSFIVLSSFHEK